MWQWTIDRSVAPSVYIYAPRASNARVSYREFLSGLATDSSARTSLVGALAAAPFEGYFWECPPLSTETADRGATFALVDAPALPRLRADDGPFRQQLRDAEYVAVFPNLGGDATLVAPTRASDASYAHLASFVRTAPIEQLHAFWSAVGKLGLRSIGPTSRWLSTAGLGISWLHVRLDDRPKYYRYAPYRTG